MNDCYLQGLLVANVPSESLNFALSGDRATLFILQCWVFLEHEYVS